MICHKCNKENSHENKVCIYCGATLEESYTTNIPLSGGERLKVGWLFAILILPFGGFGMAIIPLLILWSSIYIMKKDRKFLPILKAKTYLKFYLALLALMWIIVIGVNYYADNEKIYNINYSYEPKQNPEYKVFNNPKYKLVKNPTYDSELRRAKNLYGSDVCVYYPYLCPDKYIGNGESEFISNGQPQFLPLEEMYLYNPKIKAETTGVVIGSIFGFSIVYAVLIFLFNSLFFNVLQRHEKWVVNNGIYSDVENTYSDKKCVNCGSQLKSHGGFCPNCGHKG